MKTRTWFLGKSHCCLPAKRQVNVNIPIAHVWAVILAAGWLCAWSQVQGAPKGTPNFGKDLAVYLGCGEVEGPGTVVQLEGTGRVLGTVQLPGTPYGLAVNRNSLVAAVPGDRPGMVVRISGDGKVETLLQDKKNIPCPIAIATDPGSGDILVADNEADVLLRLPAGNPTNAQRLIRIEGQENHFQDMSIAFTQDGCFLYGSDEPKGIYRFAAEENPTLGEPVLRDVGAVAADPSSMRWVAALRNELRVFEGRRELLRLPYPAGMRKWQDTVAFGPDGTLVIALLGQNWHDVMLADLNARTFHPLFSWKKSRVVSVAVGPRMTWKE